MPKIDAIVYWPPTDKAYFFRGSNYVRYRLSGGEKAEEKVSLTEHRWKGLAFEDRIDAALTVEPEGLVYFFREDKFVPYLISDNPDEERALNQPRPIVERYSFLPPKYQSNLDAVLYWPPNECLYFFKEGSYLKCERVEGKPVQEERPLPGGWTGLPFDRIDAAFRGKHDKAYFFRGEEYLAYWVSADKAAGPAQPWKDHWPAQRSSPDEKTLWELLSEGGETDVSVSPTDTTTSGAPRNLNVGFNYPWAWNQSGFYFGAGKPPGTDPSFDRWIPDLQTNLRFLRDELNIRRVRIFLLCNAWNYGDITSTTPPHVPLGTTPLHTTGRDRFTPPGSLHRKYIDHLTGMLNAFRTEEMYVLPSFIAHRCFRPASMANGAGGRADIITNPTFQSKLLTDVLEPFLKASVPYMEFIDAWEVVSEPIWNVSTLFGAVHAYKKMGGAFAPNADVSESDMKTFIEKAVRLIEGYGFASTVGHRFYRDLSSALPNGNLRQFHYYPQTYTFPTPPVLPGPAIHPQIPYADPDPLPTFAESNAILGEFSCQLPGDETDGWPELKGADTSNVSTAVHERLRLLNSKGYPLAFLWYDAPASPWPGPDSLKLSKDAKDGIKRFMAAP